MSTSTSSLVTGVLVDNTSRVDKLEEAVRLLMSICAENEIELSETTKKIITSGLEAPLLVGGEESRVVDDDQIGSLVTHTSYIMDNVLKRSKMADYVSLEEEYKRVQDKLKSRLPEYEIRLINATYTVTNYYDKPPSSARRRQSSSDDDEEAGAQPRRAKQKIRTVGTENIFYRLYRIFRNCMMNRGMVRSFKEDVVILKDINLCFETGKMYLLLGAPGAGKSTLLNYVSNTLFQDKNHVVGGSLDLAGIHPGQCDVCWPNLVAYIDQIDRFYPFLTVKETCVFAWHCRTGGTHRKLHYVENDEEAEEMIKQMDTDMYVVNKILDGIGLEKVADTFVGDQQNVRGVSGGEQRRCTLSEMLSVGVPCFMCDEISTGLDSATTTEITRVVGNITRMANTLKVVSLLQPPPETVANFDEIILMAEGMVIYSGPIGEVENHFRELGYEIPERMDLADWLQELPTKDGWRFLKGGNGNPETIRDKHLSPAEFHDGFYSSRLGLSILGKLNNSPIKSEGDEILIRMASQRYDNPWHKSFYLLLQRDLLLWWRDKYQIKAKVIQTLIMGVVVGTLFWQSTDKPRNTLSIIFQSLFYTTISAMSLVRKQFPARSILYKHQDAKFFPTSAYVLSRSIATFPNALADSALYGTMIYFLAGLAYNDGASIGNYFIFVLLLFTSSLTAGLVFGILPSIIKVETTAQACMAVLAMLLNLFSGFTVQPNVIPVYYIWAYWINYFAWLLRSLVVNEFQSGKYDDPSPVPEVTKGEAVLAQFGFGKNGEAYTFEWVWWGFLFAIAIALFSMMLTTCFFTHIRFSTGQTLVTDPGSNDERTLQGGSKEEENNEIELSFQKVDLTFKDISYTITASTSKEQLKLLKGIDGVIECGKMTALMGSSGAGKTTLMDVIAMRKTSGEVTGDIRLNGHPQETLSFARCMGYVEQFDVQSPQLTIRETVQFSAKLRLDESDPAVTSETIEKFVDQTLAMLDLTIIQNLQVGSDATGGLSFEQRKRLSIAVELVANPSIIFLDEPTSGLDASAAALVMQGMKRIALSGRAVCATIHQPSVAIFNSFDCLLLLKPGGEVVFFGDLGHEGSNLIKYFERYEATPKIQPGENPSTWMLTIIGAGALGGKMQKPFDYAGSYSGSKLHANCLEKIDQICAKASDDNKILFTSQYATSLKTQYLAVLRRALKVYYRSPSYNVSRSTVSAFIALIFASVYASQRFPTNESDMNSRINSIFMAVLFLSVTAQNTVLGIFETERNMFYRHKTANMYNPASVLSAFTIAEFPFILLASTVFNLLFYFLMGLTMDAGKFFLFFMFITFAIALYTFLGQMLISLLRDSQTAQAFGGLIVSFTALFAGIFIRPSDIPTFWIFMYWIMPGHWIMEGLIMPQFADDMTLITASLGSPFYRSLGCGEPDTTTECQGTVSHWMSVNFEYFSMDHIKWDALYLIVAMILSRLVSLLALRMLDYRST